VVAVALAGRGRYERSPIGIVTERGEDPTKIAARTADMRGQMLAGDLDPGGQNGVFGAAELAGRGGSWCAQEPP